MNEAQGTHQSPLGFRHFELLSFETTEFVLFSASARTVVVSAYFSVDHFILQNPIMCFLTSHTTDAFNIVSFQI